jgi:hypothetical protein
METALILFGLAICASAPWAVMRHDWLRLTRPALKVDARVIGHRRSLSDGDTSWAAIYAFEVAGKTHEVTDQIYHLRPKPPIGTQMQLVYPHDHPELARAPRRLMWASVYAALLLMPAILVAKFFGWIGS